MLQYEEEIKDNSIEITLNFSEAPVIFSIRSTLYGIISKLISNAIKYRSSERTPGILFTTRIAADRVLLEITDNGLGMDLSQIGDKLFTMYKRFHRHVLGRGLGLFLIKEETEILGGSIDVKSEINRFTTFTLTFPIGNPDNK